MADEVIDIYNENNEGLNIQKMRSEAHKSGLWHRVSHIWIYNSNREILIQLRSENKELYPNMWDISVAGHIGAGEEPVISALREIEEEIGLSVKPEDLQFFKIRKHKVVYREIKNNEFCYVYFLKFNGDIKKLSLQEEEVIKIQFLSFYKLVEELKMHPEKYALRGDYWFEVMEELRRRTKK